MKLITHYLFSIGVMFFSVSLFLNVNPFTLLLVLSVFSVAGNVLIDRLGHEVRGGYIRRTPRTHTLGRSVFWGILPAIPLILYAYLFNSYIALVIFLSCVLIGPLHIFLDSLTERGIYVRSGGRWRRFSLASFRYNNPVINGWFCLIGVLLLYVSLVKFF
ncbi:hypothetical protein HS7_00090 [Sulfolobales archaeon HS-7]|nr:hypothetical protein HS7_00090 [Sulfolobales archaeon HS-7]